MSQTPQNRGGGSRTYTNKRIIFTTLVLRHGKNVEKPDFFVKIGVMGGGPPTPKIMFLPKVSHPTYMHSERLSIATTVTPIQQRNRNLEYRLVKLNTKNHTVIKKIKILYVDLLCSRAAKFNLEEVGLRA